MSDKKPEIENIYEYIRKMPFFQELLDKAGEDGDDPEEVMKFTKAMAEKYQPILDQINIGMADQNVRTGVLKGVAKQAGIKIKKETDDV